MNAARPSSPKREHTPMAALFVRLYWIAVGPVFLFGTAAILWSRHDTGHLPFSLLFWLNVGLILLARYADIRFYDGQTTELEPADMGHLRRHALRLLPLALVVWGGVLLAADHAR